MLHRLADERKCKLCGKWFAIHVGNIVTSDSDICEKCIDAFFASEKCIIKKMIEELTKEKPFEDLGKGLVRSDKNCGYLKTMQVQYIQQVKKP